MYSRTGEGGNGTKWDEDVVLGFFGTEWTIINSLTFTWITAWPVKTATDETWTAVDGRRLIGTVCGAKETGLEMKETTTPH